PRVAGPTAQRRLSGLEGRDGGERLPPQFAAARIAVYELAGVEVVFRVAAVPLREEVPVEGDEEADPRILVLQGEDVLRLPAELGAAVAVLHPDMVAQH